MQMMMAFRRFAKDTSGATFVYIALVMFAIAGFGGLAIDVGHWYQTQRSAQSTADAAAIAAAYEAAWSGDLQDVEDAAEKLAALNGFGPATVTVHYPPTQGEEIGNADAVEVIITQPSAGFLSSLFLDDDTVNVSARGVAAPSGSPACITTLDQSGAQSLDVSGVTIDVPDCGIQVNSTHSQAMKTTATSTVTAASICVAGDVEGSGNLSPSPQTGCKPTGDPLASLAKPSLALLAEQGQCDYPGTVSVDGTTETLSPGVYCNGIDIKGGADVTFLPGIYVVQGKEFIISDSTISGTGVSFYLADDAAVLDIGGNSTITLSAPTTGEMTGILFFGNRDTPGIEKHVIADGSNSDFDGIIYFPDGLLKYEWDGSAGTKSAHVGLFVRQLELTGTGTLSLDVNGSSVPLPYGVAISTTVLVE